MASDGSLVTSNRDIDLAFIEYFTSLLGTAFVPMDPVNECVIEEGPLLPQAAA
ncbi:hypothetical protein Dimus_004352, partial [Dionaea muscipula]